MKNNKINKSYDVEAEFEKLWKRLEKIKKELIKKNII